MQVSRLSTSLGLLLRRALSRLPAALTDRKVLVLLGILALAAYLRLWNIHHLFNAIHDYDEGVYALGARFISQGYLPYQDFMLTHPPLYSLTLASIYKVFGYDFFYGKYLSVFLSLASIVVIYLAGKKMYHPGAGLAAAALFAVSPEMVYFGRRCVQESMGIFLVLVAVYLAIDFITTRKSNRLLFAGLALGLAVATKYIFVPAAAAVIAATTLLTMGEHFWMSVRTLGRASFWIPYVCITAIFFASLLPLRWSLNLDIAIPFFDPMYISAGNVAVAILVFIVPLVIALALQKRSFPVGEWWVGVWKLRRNRGLWLLLGGTILGFVVVTGYFWIKMPREFVYQTFLMQQNRPYIEFPSLAAMVRTALASPDFLTLAFLPVLLAIPLVLVILNKGSFTRNDCFLSVGVLVSLVLCQGFYHLPRYYISAFPFLLLGLSGLMPRIRVEAFAASLQSLGLRIRAGFLAVLASFLLLMSISIVLLTNYTGYDINWPWLATNEEYVYRETVGYLEESGARKIWAVNPIFAAMAPDLDSTLAFDSFALLWLEETPSEEIVRDRIAEGVDYVVVDSWVKYWAYPYDRQAMELAQAIRRNARLVKVIAPGSLCGTEIYLLGAEKQGVFNGQFERWGTYEQMSLPLGWDAVLVDGKGDLASISRADFAGKDCVRVTVSEDGQKFGKRDSTHAGISQKILFPEGQIRVEVLPELNTAPSARPELLPGIHFMDDAGHALIVGFSDRVRGEEVYRYEEGYRILVIQEAQLHEWSEQTIELSRYWSQAGWPQPREVTMLIVISAHCDNPGFYAFHIASVQIDRP